MKDPIVSEIHTIREQLLLKHHGDPVAYVKDAMKRQYGHPHRLIHPQSLHASQAQVSEPESIYPTKN